MAHFLLAGYFGEGNLGDDAMLLVMADALRSLGQSVAVLSGAPEETFHDYGYRSIPRKNMREFTAELAEADALVFPGGSIFQDSTSVASVAYYHNLVKRAKAARKKVALVGQGVGPLKTMVGKRLATKAFQMADVIAVRDPGSLEALRALGVKRPVYVTADPAFLLKPRSQGEGDLPDFGVGVMRTVGLSPRPHKTKGFDAVEMFGDLARRLFAAGYMPVLIEMDRKLDGPLIYAIGKTQGGKVPDLRRLTTPWEMHKRIERMEAIIAMRLHAGVMAATAGTPPLMLNYDPKVAALSRLLDVGAALPLENLTSQRVFETFAGWIADRDRIVGNMNANVAKLRDLAAENVKLVAELCRPTVTV